MYHQLELEKPQNDLRVLSCVSGLVKIIFDYYNCGELANYIGKELIFCKYYRDTKTIIPSIFRRTKDVFDELKTDFAFNIEEHTFNTVEDAWEHVARKLQEGIISLLFLDTYYYPNSPEYQKSHSLHCIAVNGCTNTHITLYDTGYRFYDHQMSKELIDKAWREKRYRTIDIDKNQNPYEISKEEYIEILRTNIKNMLNPDVQSIYDNITLFDTVPNKYENIKIGIEEISSLSQEIQTLTEKANLKENIIRLIHQIYYVSEQTDLHSVFLHNMSRKFGFNEILAISEEVRYIAQEWLVVRNILIKATIKNTNDMIVRSANKVKSIAHRETDCIHKLKKIVNG